MVKSKVKRPRATGLNNKQRAIVAKHQRRNELKRAMQTGTPEERAAATYKYYYDFTDIQYENGRALIERTPEYLRIRFRYRLESKIESIAAGLVKILTGRRK